MFVPVDTPPHRELRPADSQISPGDWEILSHYWYPVAVSTELGKDPIRVKVLDVELALFRGPDGQPAAVLDMCPHRLVRLSAGKVVDGEIECAFHGLRFDAVGRCTRVPALGKLTKLPPSYRVSAFPIKEKFGLIWTCLGDPEKHALPVFPRFETAALDEIEILPVLDWPVSAPRQIENFFDLAHLPFIHKATIGGDQDFGVKPGRVEHTDTAVILHAKHHETAHGEVDCLYLYHIVLPCSLQFHVVGEQDPSYEMYSCDIASPTSAHSCRVFQLVLQPRDRPRNTKIAAGLAVVNSEDIGILATTRLADLPLTTHHEIHLPVDNISNAYRSRLRQLGLGGGAATDAS